MCKDIGIHEIIKNYVDANDILNICIQYIVQKDIETHEIVHTLNYFMDLLNLTHYQICIGL